MAANQAIKIIFRFFIIAATLLYSCSEPTPTPEFSDSPSGIISIAHLKTLATGQSRTITEDISIEGYIVANDLFGEYYKSIVLCDESGGIEISIETNSTASIFPCAAKVRVHCTSLVLGNYFGRVILGAKSYDYTVGRIDESDFTRYFTIDRLSPKTIEPTPITIAEISPALIGNYVEIADVEFTDGGKQRWCDIDCESGEIITTERELCDTQGHSIWIRTIAQCSYASEMLPTGRGRIRGIIERYSNHYSLRIVNRQFDFKD